MDEIVVDLTDPENDDWIKVSQAGLVDLALCLPPDTDVMEYLRERPDMPLARAVLSREVHMPADLPSSAVGRDDERLQQLRRRLAELPASDPHRVDSSD